MAHSRQVSQACGWLYSCCATSPFFHFSLIRGLPEDSHQLPTSIFEAVLDSAAGHPVLDCGTNSGHAIVRMGPPTDDERQTLE